MSCVCKASENKKPQTFLILIQERHCKILRHNHCLIKQTAGKEIYARKEERVIVSLRGL